MSLGADPTIIRLQKQIDDASKFQQDQAYVNGEISAQLAAIQGALADITDSIKELNAGQKRIEMQVNATNGRVLNHETRLGKVEGELPLKASVQSVTHVDSRVSEYIRDQKKVDEEQSSAIRTLQDKELKLSTTITIIATAVSVVWGVVTVLSKYLHI